MARGSTGVERRRLDRGWEVREEVLVARSVEVNAERGLLTPLWHGESRVLERDAWAGLLAETGGGGRHH